MALKMKVSPSVYDAMPADVKKEYKKEGDDYVLDLEGYEDPAEIKRARDNANAERNTAKADAAKEKKRADDAEKRATELEASGKSVDDAVKAKETEWQTKYDKDIKERDDKYNGLTGAVLSDHRKSLADTLANKISTSPSLLSPRIAERIETEIDPATNTIKSYIKGSDGKRTSWTMDDLEKDILKNREFAPILRGTKASGGGGAPPAPGGGGAPRQPLTPGAPAPSYATMPAAELAASIRERKEAEGRA